MIDPGQNLGSQSLLRGFETRVLRTPALSLEQCALPLR